MDNVPRIHYIEHSRRDSKNMKELKCEPEQIEDRTICMSMYNGIVWEERGNTETCEKNHLNLKIMHADSRADIGHSWDLDQRRNGTELVVINQTEIETELLQE